MSQFLVLGVDIGLQGAVALLEGTNLISIDDMPILPDGPARRPAINAPLLADIIFKSHAAIAYVELIWSRPQEGAVGAFAFGRSRGVVEGVLGACGIQVVSLSPVKWRRALYLPKLVSKNDSRAEAIRRWPMHAAMFSRCKDDGRAEACLIACAGMLLR